MVIKRYYCACCYDMFDTGLQKNYWWKLQAWYQFRPTCYRKTSIVMLVSKPTFLMCWAVIVVKRFHLYMHVPNCTSRTPVGESFILTLFFPVSIISLTWRFGVLERCRDGRYSINALHCDVQLVCLFIGVCIVACFLAFWGEVFFVGVLL